MDKNQSIEIQNGIFYVLDTGQKKWLFNRESEAIKFLRGLVRSDDSINPENLNILTVDTTSKDWKIGSIPWSKIAVEIIRGD